MIVSYSMGVNRPRASCRRRRWVGAFDPGDDGDAQFVATVPAAAVQHVLLQEREERLHGGVVSPNTTGRARAERKGRIMSIHLDDEHEDGEVSRTEAQADAGPAQQVLGSSQTPHKD
jgi:hypothetical protein